MEGLGGRQGEAEKRREEEICGEIIIPGVTVATFCEVDVNKILSYTIHFNFTSKKEKDAAEGRAGCHSKEKSRTSTHERVSVPSSAKRRRRRRWRLATCAAYRRAGRHNGACSRLTCQNSGTPRLLAFGFSGFELLEIKWKRMR